MDVVTHGLATSQAARRLGLSAQRVRQLADAGRLPCQRTGLGRLFDPIAVERFAAKRRQRAAPDRPGGGAA